MRVSGPGGRVTAMRGWGSRCSSGSHPCFRCTEGPALAALYQGIPNPVAAQDPTASSGALHLCHDDSFHSFFPHACSLPPEYKPIGAACLPDCLGLSWISTWHGAGHTADSRQYGIYGEARADRSANQSPAACLCKYSLWGRSHAQRFLPCLQPCSCSKGSRT